MKLFGKSQILHHFKICFPVPVEKQATNKQEFKTASKDFSIQIIQTHQAYVYHLMATHNLHKAANSFMNHYQIFEILIGKSTFIQTFCLHIFRGQSNIINILCCISRANHFCKYDIIDIDPYSIIGDIGTTQKSYRNIKKLLDLIGIKYTQLGSKNQSSQLWNQFVEQSQKEKEITKKWLNVVETNMINSVIKRRKISKQQAQILKNKILHPQEALKARLIDSVATFEQFAAINYPNHSIEDIVYKLDGTRIHPNLTQRELSAFQTLFEVIQMPNVALATSQDLILSSLNEIIDLLQSRLINQQSLDQLQYFLEMLFNKVEAYKGHQGLVF